MREGEENEGDARAHQGNVKSQKEMCTSSYLAASAPSCWIQDWESYSYVQVFVAGDILGVWCRALAKLNGVQENGRQQWLAATASLKIHHGA